MIAVGVVAALVIMLVLWWLRRDTGPAVTRTDPGAAHPPASDHAATATPHATPSRPSTPAAGAAAVDPGSTSDTRVHVTDTGRIVRDHRPGLNEDPTLFPAPLPPEQRTMSSAITADLAQQLRPIVAGCGRDVPAADRGAEPTVMVTLTVNVAQGRLSTTDVNAGSVDIAEASRDRLFAACVRDHAASLAAVTGDEPDLTDYIVQFPIPLR